MPDADDADAATFRHDFDIVFTIDFSAILIY